jgi:hypothetical protein
MQQIANQKEKGQIIAQAASGVGSALMQAAGATFGGASIGAGSPGGGGVTSQPNYLQNMGKSYMPYNNNYKMINPYIGQALSGSGFA